MAALSAQDSGLTARQLYLQEAPPPKPKTALAAPKISKSPPKASITPQPSQSKQEVVASPDAPQGSEVANQASSPYIPIALHLGLRYNLVKYVDREREITQSVEPEFNFKTGDGFAVEFQPNRSGYLYVFNRNSDGTFSALLPSLLHPEELDRATAGTVVKVPRKNCFVIEEPMGTETLLVVLTEREEDFSKLNEAIRKSVKSIDGQQKPASASESAAISEVLIAMQRSAADKHDGEPAQLVSRNLSIQKIGKPESEDEPANSVYVVNPSSKNHDVMVIEIKIRHE
jgi:hypothetical protein